MLPDLEREFLSDMQTAVSTHSSEARRQEAIEWHVARLSVHNQKILQWLVQLQVSNSSNTLRCQSLIRAVFKLQLHLLKNYWVFT